MVRGRRRTFGRPSRFVEHVLSSRVPLFEEQTAAEREIFVGEDDAGAGASLAVSAAASPAGPAPMTSRSQ